ncbi:MAG: hypothetical protein ABI765_03795 [Gemmatimonadota bacterium]
MSGPAIGVAASNAGRLFQAADHLTALSRAGDVVLNAAVTIADGSRPAPVRPRP